MGCFDYYCQCNGKICRHVGGQSDSSTVVIEVPLSDGKTIYLKGEYEEYGYVAVKMNGNKSIYYQFYLEENKDQFHWWFKNHSENFLETYLFAKRVWTHSEVLHITEIDEAELEGEELDDDEGMIVVKRNCFNLSHNYDTILTPELVAKCIRADSLISK